MQGLRKGDIGSALDDIEWRDLLPGASVPRCDGYSGLEFLGCVGLGGAVTVHYSVEVALKLY